MQDCLNAWPASSWSFWPRLIMKYMHTIEPFEVGVLSFPEWWEVLHCSLVAERGPPAPTLFYTRTSFLHTSAVLASGASTNTRRRGLVGRNRVTNDPNPWVCGRHQILPRVSGQLTNNEQVWVSTLSGMADTDGLESCTCYSFITAYILYLGRPWWQKVLGCLKWTAPYRRHSSFPEKIWLHWLGEKQ